VTENVFWSGNISKGEVFFMKLIVRAAALFVMAVPFASFAQNGEQSPAEQRARELVQLITTGKRPEMRKYIEANYSAELLKMPMELHLRFLSLRQDLSRGYEVVSVQDSKPTSATLLLKSKLTGEYEAIFVAVENAAQFKIAGIGPRPPKPPAGEAKSRTEAEVGRELGAFVKKLADADVFSGTVLLAKDGKPVFQGAYGLANKDFNVPNKIDTKFNLGSMNKMFTAVAVAQLVEKGKLSYDDQLSKFIPEFPDAASAQKIRIKHLLSHTSGLGGYFSERWAKMSRSSVRTVDDMMAIAKQDEKLKFEPGSKWQYSNTGMLVLGKVIEIVSGKSYFDYIAENVTGPVGMANTGCFELDRVNTNLAVGYDKQYTEKGIEWSNNIFEHVMRGGPQGGCYSTVEDLLRFDQALRSNKLISAETFKTLASPKPELNSPNYGYGFQVWPAENAAGHGGGFTGINSNLEIWIGSGWSAIVMSNYSGGAQPLIQKMDLLIKSTLKQMEPVAKQ
jgi:CubicO group peptidase (beta-lactamase class C family)